MLVQGKPVQLTVDGRPKLEAWRYYLYLSPVPILGGLLTLLFMTLNSCFCCSLSPDLQYSVLKPAEPLVEFVVNSSEHSKRIAPSEAEENQPSLTAV